jgi:hypothetical protein
LYYPYALPPARPREIFFWWRDFLKVLPKFKHLVIYNCVQENYILLWKDIWTDVPLQDTWPRLLSVAKNGFISLKYALAAPDISVLFHLPVSEEVIVQLNLFEALLQESIPGNGFDFWSVMGNHAYVKMSHVYKALMGNVCYVLHSNGCGMVAVSRSTRFYFCCSFTLSSTLGLCFIETISQ